MLKSKRIVSMLLAMVMALSIGCVGAFADEGKGSGIVVPQSSSLALEVTLSSVNGSENHAFTVTSAEPYFKVWIQNTSTAIYKVRVTEGSTSGPQAGYTTVSPGTPGRIYSNGPVSAGTYWVSVNSVGGSPLSGPLAVRIASTEGDLGKK